MDVKLPFADLQMLGTSIRTLTFRNPFIGIDDNGDYKRRVDLSHTITEIEEREPQSLVGGVILEIKATVSLGKEKLSIALCIEGGFQCENANREDFEKLLNINGVAALYSIARSIILSLSAQSLAYGNVLLPMINVYKYSQAIDSKKEQLETPQL